MARNGHDKPAESLRREAAERRAAVRRTAAALEDRLRHRGHQVSEAVEQAQEVVERTRGKFHGVDVFVHRYRYVILGGALGAGVVLGLRRRARPAVRTADMDEAVRLILDRQRPSMMRSVFGGAAAIALRYGINLLSQRLMEEPAGSYEPLLLPPGRPYAE